MNLQKRVPSSVDNMNPRNPFIKTLASIPVAPGVAYNSIISVKQRPTSRTGMMAL